MSLADEDRDQSAIANSEIQALQAKDYVAVLACALCAPAHTRPHLPPHAHRYLYPYQPAHVGTCWPGELFVALLSCISSVVQQAPLTKRASVLLGGVRFDTQPIAS